MLLRRCARTLPLIAFAITLAGCASSGGKLLPPSGNTTYGVYHFRNVLATAHPPVTLEGSVTLLPNEVTLALANSPCAERPSSRDSRSIHYTCGEFSFWIDRRNPLRENAYTVPTVQWDTRRICIISTVDRNGREVCTSWGSERVERRTSVTGKLTFFVK
jgi:hypothetical protein